MSTSSFRDDWLSMLSELDTVPSLNYGGCGIAALAMLRWLEREYPEVWKTAGVLSVHERGDWSGDRAHNLRWLNGQEEDADSAGHFRVIIDGVAWDSYSNKDLDEYSSEYIIIVREPNSPEDYCLSAVNNYYADWVTDFDRVTGVPLIERLLGVDLSDVSLYHCSAPEQVVPLRGDATLVLEEPSSPASRAEAL